MCPVFAESGRPPVNSFTNRKVHNTTQETIGENMKKRKKSFNKAPVILAVFIFNILEKFSVNYQRKFEKKIVLFRKTEPLNLLF